MKPHTGTECICSNRQRFETSVQISWPIEWFDQQRRAILAGCISGVIIESGTLRHGRYLHHGVGASPVGRTMRLLSTGIAEDLGPKELSPSVGWSENVVGVRRVVSWLIDGIVQLRGAEFDAAYAANELAYHQAVNDLVENTMIPNIDNAEVKALFEQGLGIFKAHEAHAEMMVKALQ